MSIAGIILAAGASSRMGRPKPLLQAGTETFADRLIGTMAGACKPVILVLGYAGAEVRSGIARGAEAAVVVNERCAEGQLSSLQCGLAAAPQDAEALIFTPVDHPHLRPSTLEALAAKFAETGAPAVVARYKGRRGHPVLLSPASAQAIRELPPGSRASEVVNGPGTVYVEVDDRSVAEDIDDPETYNRLLAEGALG